MWNTSFRAYSRSENEKRDPLEVPAVFLHNTHPEIKDALMADSGLNDSNNVLRIDFEELFDTITPDKQPSSNRYRAKMLVSCATQTEEEDQSIICSKCLRCGERTDVKVKLDFGDTPLKNTSSTSKPTPKQNVIAAGPIIRPVSKEPQKPMPKSGGVKVYDTFVNRRLMFRNKWQKSSIENSQYVQAPKTNKQIVSPMRVNQKTYANKFETKKKFYENSDVKYFSIEKRRNTMLNSPSKHTRSYVNLSKSFSRILEENSGSKFAGSGNSRHKLSKNKLNCRSLGIISIDESDTKLSRSIDRLAFDGRLHDRQPISVDIDLQAISMAEDSLQQSYVRSRDPRGVPVA